MPEFLLSSQSWKIFWCWVVQGNKEISNVIFHGQASSPVGVIWSVGTGQVNTGEFLALPVLGDCVVLLEGFCKVVSILLPHIFHTKIIHNLYKLDGAPAVAPQSGRRGSLVVTCLL